MHLALERRLAPGLRKELAQRARIDHRAGERVTADLASLLEHRDRDLELVGRGRIVLLDQPREVIRPSQTRRSGADE